MTLFVFIIIDMCKLVLIRTSCDAMVLVDCHSLSFSVLFMINLFKYGSRNYIFYHYLLSLNYLRPTCLTCQRYENLGLHDLNDVYGEWRLSLPGSESPPLLRSLRPPVLVPEPESVEIVAPPEVHRCRNNSGSK